MERSSPPLNTKQIASVKKKMFWFDKDRIRTMYLHMSWKGRSRFTSWDNPLLPNVSFFRSRAQ